MKKLIITADDYGMSVAVNKAIDAGIQAGLITATNVMTNMDYYKEASKLKQTNASIGIHWTLSCGRPVSKVEDIPTLVNKEGDFYSYPEFRERYRKGLINDSDIKIELENQYNLYFEILGKPDYWNTHQNVHVDFKIYKVFVDVASKLGIKRMRSHQRIYVNPIGNDSKLPLKWRISEPIKAQILNAWQNKAHKKGILSPEGLIVCINKSDANKMNKVFSYIKWGKKNIGEFVIHPATECDSQYFGKIVDQRIREYELFTNNKTYEFIKKANIELVNYNSL